MKNAADRSSVPPAVKRFIVHRSSFIVLIALATTVSAQTVRITEKPTSLVSGTLYVPIIAGEPVQRIALFINGVKFAEAPGRTANVQVNVGQYIRRMRMRAVGYDAQDNAVAEDEMVVNDPRPPFRVRLQAPREYPQSGSLALSANVIKPPELDVA